MIENHDRILKFDDYNELVGTVCALESQIFLLKLLYQYSCNNSFCNEVQSLVDDCISSIEDCNVGLCYLSDRL